MIPPRHFVNVLIIIENTQQLEKITINTSRQITNQSRKYQADSLKMLHQRGIEWAMKFTKPKPNGTFTVDSSLWTERAQKKSNNE